MTDIPAVLATIDTDRLTELVREVCRIPSVLGEEGPLAAFLHDLMRESGFEAAELQPVIGDRPNALGELSFGAGPRVCVGNHFALLEGQIVLASLLRRLSFEVQPGVDVGPNYAATLRPAGGLPMVVRRRSDANAVSA